MVPSQTMGFSHRDAHDLELFRGKRDQLGLNNISGAGPFAQTTHPFFPQTIESSFSQNQRGAFVGDNRGDLEAFFELLNGRSLVDYN